MGGVKKTVLHQVTKLPWEAAESYFPTVTLVTARYLDSTCLYRPASLGDDHLRSQGVELSPQVPVFQGDLDVLVRGVRLCSCHDALVLRRAQVMVASKLLPLTHW